MKTNIFVIIACVFLFVGCSAKQPAKPENVDIHGTFLPYSTAGLWIGQLEFLDGKVTSTKSSKTVGFTSSVVDANNVIELLPKEKSIHIVFDTPLFIEEHANSIAAIIFPYADLGKEDSQMNILTEGNTFITTIVRMK